MALGRKPAPTAVKLLKGTRPDRVNAHPLASPTPGDPKPPADLSDNGRAEWSRILDDLRSLGVLDRTDRAVISLYVTQYETYCEALSAIRDDGLVFNTDLGGVKTNPATTVANQAASQMRQLLSEMGLTPSARSRLTQPKPEADALGDFLASSG